MRVEPHAPARSWDGAGFGFLAEGVGLGEHDREEDQHGHGAHVDEQLHEGEWVVEAIGQMSDMSLLGEELTEKLEWNRGRIQVDDAGRTSEPWLWAAGDCVKGPDVVSAVATGHNPAGEGYSVLGVFDFGAGSTSFANGSGVRGSRESPR